MDRIMAAMPQAREAVVVGAGYIGLEVAEQFVRRGLKVTVVELQDQVMPFFDREIAEPLHRESERNGVRHFKGTIEDLGELDLAYAPPFGSAKDPLHMAAFVAQNDLDGLAPLIQPDADLSELQVVDVREAAELEDLDVTGETKLKGGFTLEYDAARKVAPGSRRTPGRTAASGRY
jgi:NAD(P)-dependent dehydrogenase (short-subunit alcohol dehydrogenase family)